MGKTASVILHGYCDQNSEGKARSPKSETLYEDGLLFIATFFIQEGSAVVLPLAVSLSSLFLFSSLVLHNLLYKHKRKHLHKQI